MSIPVTNPELAVQEAKAAIDALLVELGKKHGVDFQWQVHLPPAVTDALEKRGIVQIVAPTIELICTPTLFPNSNLAPTGHSPAP